MTTAAVLLIGTLVACGTAQTGTAAPPGSTGPETTSSVVAPNTTVLVPPSIPPTGPPTAPSTPGSEVPGSTEPPTSVVDPPPTDGPGPDAVPILWLTNGPGYYCNTMHTLLPRMVVYSDFSVLSTDEGIGAYCEPVPTITAGTVDPALVQELLQMFADEKLAGIDLRLDNVMDAGTGFVSIADPETGRPLVAAAYAMGIDIDLPADQVAPRAAMKEIGRKLQDGVTETGTWKRDRLVALEGDDWMGEESSGPTPTWPSDTPGTECAEVPDADVSAVLKANGDRNGGSPWKVDGKEVNLAIGVVLPGFQPCVGPVSGTEG